jgi:hypothetical protein
MKPGGEEEALVFASQSAPMFRSPRGGAPHYDTSTELPCREAERCVWEWEPIELPEKERKVPACMSQ